MLTWMRHSHSFLAGSAPAETVVAAGGRDDGGEPASGGSPSVELGARAADRHGRRPPPASRRGDASTVSSPPSASRRGDASTVSSPQSASRRYHRATRAAWRECSARRAGAPRSTVGALLLPHKPRRRGASFQRPLSRSSVRRMGEPTNKQTRKQTNRHGRRADDKNRARPPTRSTCSLRS